MEQQQKRMVRVDEYPLPGGARRPFAVICPGGGYEKISDPLEGEKAVLSLYFDFLTSRENGSPFSSEALMIYALKLQILERMNAFDEEKGRAEFDRLYEAIEGNIKG